MFTNLLWPNFISYQHLHKLSDHDYVSGDLSIVLLAYRYWFDLSEVARLCYTGKRQFHLSSDSICVSTMGYSQTICYLQVYNLSPCFTWPVVCGGLCRITVQDQPTTDPCTSLVYLSVPLTTCLICEVLPDVLKCSEHPGAPRGWCQLRVKTTLAVLSILTTGAIAWYDRGAPWNLNRDLFDTRTKQVHQGSDHGIRPG